jgi:cell division protein FtsB
MADAKMEYGNPQAGKSAAAAAPEPLQKRAYDWAMRAWRPAGTAVAVGLAGLLMWHVVNGKDGLSVWQQKRTEDRQLQKEIQALQQENAQLRERISRLQSDPDAIERVAREKMHYAKPGEVIYDLPAAPAQPAAAGK